MLEFIYGKEKYLVKEKLLQVQQDFAKKFPQGTVSIFALEDDFNLAEITQAVQSSGLFAREKLVILENSLALNQAKQEQLLEFLRDFKKRKDSQTFLTVVELSSKDNKGKLFNFLKKADRAHKFDFLKGAELSKWIDAEVKKESAGKVAIDREANNWLGLITKGDLWRVSREIKKIVNFKTSGQIDLDEVRQICQGQAEGKIFDLVDAVGQGNKPRSLELKKQLFNQGENEFYIFSMIIFQMRNLLKVSQCVKKGMTDKQVISRKLGLHPFVVQKTLGQLRAFPEKRLAAAYQLAAEIDLKSKQSDFQMEQELDYFLIKI